MDSLEPIGIDEIRAARERLAGKALRTPLVPFLVPDAPAPIYLKLENLQPIGSFKLRGAGNAMALAGPETLARGVVTASAGNMAQGVAWNARELGVPCHVVVPDHAPRTKLEAIERMGGHAVPVPFERWWRVLEERSYPGLDGVFVHPVSDPAVIAGNGTIGLEIIEDLPDVNTVIVPFGGGGLSCGIACAMKALRPQAEVFGAEVETATPLAASLTAGRPEKVEYTPSFVDGIGAGGLLPEMWPLVRDVLAGSLIASLESVGAAVRLLAEHSGIIAEGAGATSVAAALEGQVGPGPVVCVVSGGNIDLEVLADVLTGRQP